MKAIRQRSHLLCFFILDWRYCIIHLSLPCDLRQTDPLQR
jgi:hypothetical protein